MTEAETIKRYMYRYYEWQISVQCIQTREHIAYVWKEVQGFEQRWKKKARFVDSFAVVDFDRFSLENSREYLTRVSPEHTEGVHEHCSMP